MHMIGALLLSLFVTSAAAGRSHRPTSALRPGRSTTSGPRTDGEDAAKSRGQVLFHAVRWLRERPPMIIPALKQEESCPRLPSLCSP